MAIAESAQAGLQTETPFEEPRPDDIIPDAASIELADIFGASNAGLALFDEDLRLVTANEGYRRLCGYSMSDLQNRPALAKLVELSLMRSGQTGIDIDMVMQRVQAQLSAAGGHTIRFLGAAGVPILIHRRRTQSGRLLETVVEAPNEDADADADNRTQMLADTARARMAQALDAMADGFCLFDAQDRLVAYNQRYVDLNPHIADVIYHGAPYAYMMRIGIERGAFNTEGLTKEQYLELRLDHHANSSEPIETELSDGRWVRVHERKTSEGAIVGIRTDITELKQREAEILAMSEELRQRNIHFDTALNNMVQGLCMFDENQTLIVVNRRYLEMYGFSSEVVKPGITLPEIMQYSVSIGNYTEEEAARALAERPDHAKLRERATLKQRLRDGRVIAVMHQPMTNGGSIATYQDITELERHEAFLRDYTRKLEVSNRELQDFAYVASHDLQEPLRKIEAFGDRLKAKYAETLPEAGQTYVDRMGDAAARMRLLISDLLSYSQVTTKAKPYVRVDLNKVIEGVISDLQIRIEELSGEVRYADLPEIDADATQMRQLFQNLIQNALKFHKPDTPPVVEVKAEILDEPEDIEGPKCQITVSDNGIGFDNRYKDQIFAIFQRLHGRAEYEGTGIGLATCRKIVDRHSGSIDAFGEPDVGAKFIVNLPVQQGDLGAEEDE